MAKAKLKLWYVGVASDWGDSFEVEARTKKEAEDKALDLARASLLEDLNSSAAQFEIDAEIETVLE